MNGNLDSILFKPIYLYQWEEKNVKEKELKLNSLINLDFKINRPKKKERNQVFVSLATIYLGEIQTKRYKYPLNRICCCYIFFIHVDKYAKYYHHPQINNNKFNDD